MFDDINMIGQLLGARWLRNQILSNNIANADTPKYKRYDVSFEEMLKSEMNKPRLKLRTTNNRHMNNTIEKITPKVYRDSNTSYRQDGNNVDIDKEMVMLAENSLSYDILSEQIKTKFQLLSSAINGGRR